MAPLSKLTIATAGTLPHSPSDIKKWIEANGGTYTPTPTRHTTHLLASKEAYKKPHPAVQRASDLGIWIVSFDWFDDSLQARRKLSEKKYTWDAIRREKAKRRMVKKVGEKSDGMRFREGVQMVKRLIGTGMLTPAKKGGARKKKSRGFFFGESEVPDVQFVSAAEDLARRRREREEGGVEVGDEDEDEVDGEETEGSSSINSVTPTSASIPLTSSSATQFSSSFSSPPTKPSHISKSSPRPTKSPAPKSATPSTEQPAKKHWKDLYHYYTDSTGFEYKLLLLRSKLITNSFARYHVGLLESHAKPHTYCVIVQYTPPADAADTDGMNTGTKGNVPLDLAAKLRALNASTSAGGIQHGNPNPNPNITSTTYPSKDKEEEEEEEMQKARLKALTTPHTPSSARPYTATLTPPHVAFNLAFLTLRHCFRDLTHLAWEERFSDSARALQTQRAKEIGIEPYMWRKPAPGLPMGLLPQGVGLGVALEGEDSELYVRGARGLPGIDEGLGVEGVIGGFLVREAAERARRVEEEGRKVEERKRKSGQVGKKVNWNKPFFNGVSGRPIREEWKAEGKGGEKAKGMGGGGRAELGVGGLGARARKRFETRTFPKQREV
ncbi:hypothetical protein NX059_001252 [Plenodomus lindquistii]|nr:hypothetical protein NX059_001252 [Plenodomus lindquistii]